MRRLAFIQLAFLVAGCDSLSERPGLRTTTREPDVSAPSATCVSDSDCDDQHDCTDDHCEPAADGLEHCRWSIRADQCFINDVCAAAGEARADDGCDVCDPSRAVQAWTPLADGASCDDHDACTSGDSCHAGTCDGPAVACDDGNGCTRDSCDAASGCVHAALAGYSCDDGVRCTLDDRCTSQGLCAGDLNTCDDGDPCTVDACNEVEGCTHDASTMACEDGDKCTTNDRCSDGVCGAGEPTNCDDGNSCTVDTCDATVGCVHLPTLSPCCIGSDSVCDDRNPCTDDACDPLSGACSYSANHAACDDGDPCTLDDVCADELCTGGRPRPCDDLDPCTDDSCEASFPGYCLSRPRTGGDLACDDRLDCTTNDQCQGGRCVGDASACVCVPDLPSDGIKLTSLQVGASGDPGQGLDVDQSPATCSPAGQCSGGIDNALSVIAGFANDPLRDGADQGDITLVFALSSLAVDPVEVSIFQAKSITPGCNVQTQTCAWLVDRAFLDPTSCEPVAKVFAHLSGDHLVGGGPGTSLPFAIPLDADTSLDVVISNLRLDVTLTQVNGQAAALTGILGGAVPKQTLIDGIESVPADSFNGISKDAILSLVDLLVQNDIDGNGDGVKESASIGVKIIGIDAVISGVGQ